MQFDLKYFFAAVILFFVEVFIAAFVQDSIIRPYGGDFLVVIFLYCLLKSFFRLPVKNAILGVLLFAFAVECSQYLKLIGLLGMQDNKIISAVMGNHFEWLDMLLYTLGAFTIFGIEKWRSLSFRSRKTSA
ncbi:ribosomal maturation YjgA family protein [Salinimicrobium sp. TH3]|uniref:ribosomal maturation YjgA family protein n=1 Tax=Salinimicrobium sp. TH3 TaxID=2997342 RepID=UPI002272E1AD|nr:DUF2809 domain-containing protein [Salinimicrobium sp. TH3]MCY2686481.1 DUF2809 domain-containing protein [Salinimicrobium sp. TH3]